MSFSIFPNSAIGFLGLPSTFIPFEVQNRPSRREAAEDSTATYKCPNCTRTYKREYCLKRHLRVECGKNPNYQCPICKNWFMHKHNLVTHYVLHNNRKSFKYEEPRPQK
ncbi:hypothetical protein TKK_0011294 [Trichogramma kaykai]